MNRTCSTTGSLMMMLRRGINFQVFHGGSQLRCWGRPSAFSSAATATTDANGEVLFERVKGKLVITLNRPKALNALNLAMVEKIHAELQTPSDLVLIKGQGPKSFCAGGDILAVTTSWKAGAVDSSSSSNSPPVHEQFFRKEYQLNHLIGTIPQPYVALIDGITMGGGCGLSINGPFRVATERTMLSMPETQLGLFPDVGGTHFLSRLSGQLGMFLALTSYRLHGSDVFHSGLATHYVESSNILRLSTDLLHLPHGQCTREGVGGLIQRFVPPNIASFSLDPHLELIDECFAADSVEEIMRLLEEKAKAGAEFAKEQLEAMRKMSPTSLKVTFRQIRMGKHLKFAEVFPIEFRLTQRFVADNDLHEGARAILIDKDRKPKWKPATLGEVSDAKVDAYFAPFEDPDMELVLPQTTEGGKKAKI